MKPPEIDWQKLNTLIESRKTEQWGLIPLLQDIQKTFGFIPPESIEAIADALGLFPAQVQGVVTFYSGFSLAPRGKFVLRVCCGTACHVKGGRSILRLVQQDLKLKEGETSPDYQFTLESVACLGACALAPTMMVNREYFGRLSPPKVAGILNYFGKEAQEKE